MSHEMTENDQMFSVREAPWHMGMGTNVLILDSSPETRMDRMVAAGHDWTVLEHQMVDAETFDMVESWKRLVRSDNAATLFCTQESYTVVQNIIGHEIFEALIEGGTLIDATGGTTKGGRVCYLQGKLDEPRYVDGDTSPTYPYTGVLWSHDMSTGVVALEGLIRMVCQNTIKMAELMSKRSGRLYSFKHTTNVLDHIEECKDIIRGVSADAVRYIEVCNDLGRLRISMRQRDLFIRTLIPEPPAVYMSDRVKKNIDDARFNLASLFSTDTIPEAHKDSGYGLLQAGIEYLDHVRSYQSMDTYLGRTLLKVEPLKKRLVPMIHELVR